MAKEGKKKRKKPGPKPGGLRGPSLFEKRRGSTADPFGDLRLVEQHLQAYLDGEPAGLDLVQRMGRDAAFSALRFAERVNDPELLDFARRLVAVPPEVHTNLYALREEAVEARVRAAASAPALESLEGTATGSLGVFDPLQVRTALARGGRPRKETGARSKGAILALGLGVGGTVAVRFHLGLGPQERLAGLGRLRVGSGVVAVGAPEASDGPRLGTVRLDPERTELDRVAEAGGIRFARLAPGVYAARAHHPSPDRLEVYLAPDPNPNRALDFATHPELSAVPPPPGSDSHQNG